MYRGPEVTRSARPDADGYHVALPEGEDTSIKITATAPDGLSTSHLNDRSEAIT